MRAVLDTNVIVSAMFAAGTPPAQLLEAWRDRKFGLVTSRVLVREVEEVLARPKIRKRSPYTEAEVSELISSLLNSAIVVEPTFALADARDSTDNRVLEAALEGNADVIVTGDQDLLVLSPFRGIDIIPPATFLALLEQDFT